MESVRTDFFLHFEKLTEDTPHGPHVDGFIVPFFEEDDFRGSVPSGGDSEGKLGHGVGDGLDPFDFGGFGNRCLLFFFDFDSFGVASCESSFLFILGWLLFGWLLRRLLFDSFGLGNQFIFLPVIVAGLLVFLGSLEFFNHSRQPEITNLNSQSMPVNQDICRF